MTKVEEKKNGEKKKVEEKKVRKKKEGKKKDGNEGEEERPLFQLFQSVVPRNSRNRSSRLASNATRSVGRINPKKNSIASLFTSPFLSSPSSSLPSPSPPLASHPIVPWNPSAFSESESNKPESNKPNAVQTVPVASPSPPTSLSSSGISFPRIQNPQRQTPPPPDLDRSHSRSSSSFSSHSGIGSLFRFFSQKSSDLAVQTLTPSLHSSVQSIHSSVQSIHSSTPSIHSSTQSIHSSVQSIHSSAQSIHSSVQPTTSVQSTPSSSSMSVPAALVSSSASSHDLNAVLPYTRDFDSDVDSKRRAKEKVASSVKGATDKDDLQCPRRRIVFLESYNTFFVDPDPLLHRPTSQRRNFLRRCVPFHHRHHHRHRHRHRHRHHHHHYRHRHCQCHSHCHCYFHCLHLHLHPLQNQMHHSDRRRS